MKKLIVLALSLAFSNIAQAEFSPEIQAQIDSMKQPSQYPKELQKLGLYINDTLDLVNKVSSEIKDLCSAQPVFALDIMQMRQKGVEYNDVYRLLNITDGDDLTAKGVNKLSEYMNIFDDAYSYPIYEDLEDRGAATTFYMTYINHQCLLNLE